jgi:hypothetical protein
VPRATGGVRGRLDRLGVGVVAQAVKRGRVGERCDAVAPVEGGGCQGGRGVAEEFGAADATRLPGELVGVEE